MKVKLFLVFSLIIFMIIFAGCDSELHLFGRINASYEPHPVTQGETANVVIDYGEFANLRWTNQMVTIINGNDIVDVSGLTITALQPGTALLRVEATGHTQYPIFIFITEKQTFSTELEVIVE
jgi:hypothetical protein